MTVKYPLIGLFFIAQSTMAYGEIKLGDADETVIAHCIVRASGGKPWLERTLWGLRDQEAGWIGAEVLNRNGTYDLGPMQVNSQWIGRLARQLDHSPDLIRHWLIRNPCFNIDVARWIFLAGLTATNDYWRAIGAYHSPSAARQNRYARSVAQKLIQRFGSDIFRDGNMRHAR